jgi:hypothetical protein
MRLRPAVACRSHGLVVIETVTLTKATEGWKISHIHRSSRPAT